MAIQTADGCSDVFDDFVARIAGRFGRVEPRRQMKAYVRGLLGESERKNGWTLAEAAGQDGPQGMQRLLNHYRWDADAVRDDVREAVVEHLADPARGVLIPDETGVLKKGVRSAGVARRYSGTAGRIEDSQVAVFAWYRHVTLSMAALAFPAVLREQAKKGKPGQVNIEHSYP